MKVVIAPYPEDRPITLPPLDPPVKYIEDSRVALKISKLKKKWPTIGNAADHPFVEQHLQNLFTYARYDLKTLLILAIIVILFIYFNNPSGLLIMFVCMAFGNLSMEQQLGLGKLFIKPDPKILSDLWLTGINMETIIAYEIASDEYRPKLRYGAFFMNAVWLLAAVIETVWIFMHRKADWPLAQFIIFQFGCLTAWYTLYVAATTSELRAFGILNCIANKLIQRHWKFSRFLHQTLIVFAAVLISAVGIYIFWVLYQTRPAVWLPIGGAIMLVISVSALWYLKNILPDRLEHAFREKTVLAHDAFTRLFADDTIR